MFQTPINKTNECYEGPLKVMINFRNISFELFSYLFEIKILIFNLINL